MSDPKVIIEGEIKHRTSKKWKNRWCVLTKLSPVADCLHLQIYRSSKDRCRNGPTKSSLSLDGFVGMETGFTLDKESNTLALICREIVVILAFDSRESLIQWQVHVRNHTQEVEQFLVQITLVPGKSKLSCGPARLHLQNKNFCLVTGLPPRIAGHWNLSHLRKFGVVDGKFCFEGGTQCLKGEGLHGLRTNQTEEMLKAFESASVGKLTLRRKPLHRIPNETCSCWMMSSQPNCSARFQSNESSSNCQRIVSTTTTSGSEGSSCDLYLENVHFPPISSSSSSCLNHHHHHHHHCHSDINCISDDTASTRSTCCTNLRWSSASSERAASETYSNSLTSDLNSSLLQIPQSSSSDHHVTIRTSCGNDNPFLQNYDIPKVGVKNCDCTHSSNTNSSNTSSGNTNSRNTSSGNTNSNNTNESESRRSSQSNSDNDTSSAFTSDILSFKLNRELEICGDENYENSSIIYSHLMSSSSTTSSNSSGGCPTYTYALVHPCPTPVSTSTRPVIEPEQPCYSVVVKKNEKGRGGHHQHQKNEEESERRKCSSDSTSCSSSALLPSKVAGNESSSLEQHHYQVPRTAIANLYLMEKQASKGGGNTKENCVGCQKYDPSKLLSNSGEFYDTPKELKV